MPIPIEVDDSIEDDEDDENVQALCRRLAAGSMSGILFSVGPHESKDDEEVIRAEPAANDDAGVEADADCEGGQGEEDGVEDEELGAAADGIDVIGIGPAEDD